MRICFIAASVLAVLMLFAPRVQAAETTAVNSEPVWESFQCTMPSLELLLPGGTGSAVGKMHSFIAGSRVFLEGAVSYLNCLGITIQHNAVVIGHAVMKVARAMVGMRPTNEPAEPDSSAQPQNPAP